MLDVDSAPAAALPADLADAALGCTALVRARKLAEWVGTGRELTSSGVPRPQAAADACRALGIALPGTRLRSALDVGELMLDWTAAVDAGFVVVEGRRAHAAQDLTLPPDPQRVLSAWVTAAARGVGVSGEPCAGCLTILHELFTDDRPLGLAELADAVAEVTEPEAEDGEPCPDCGGFHDLADLLDFDDFAGGEEPGWEDSEEHAEDTVAGLAAFGAAAISGTEVRLTPLGSMLAAVVFEGCAPAPDADAGTLVSVINEVPPRVARTMAGPWLDARSADAAVRELLTFAESADGEQRAAALAFCTELGPGAAQAWREWERRPGFGAYARQWLAAQGDPTAQDPADEAWLAVDALSMMLDVLPDGVPSRLLAMALPQDTGGDMTEALSLLRGSGHPAAARVVARLTGRPYAVPSPAGG